MKIFNVLLAICLISLISCGGDTKKASGSADGATSTEGISSTQPSFNVTSAPDGSGLATTPPPPTAEPPQNAQGVWHYTCTKGCAGGSGSAVPCATCGATLVHNQVYHGQAGATPAPTPLGTVGSTPPPPPPPSAEPPQNAKGVWHYTCTNGCEGGAGAAAPCAKCGNTLVHNTVYHQ